MNEDAETITGSSETLPDTVNCSPATRLSHKQYIDERKLLIGLHTESTKSFDQAMITLSAGALGISITFINQIAPKPIPETVCFLHATWICFAVALVAILFSFLFSQWALSRQLTNLDVYYEKGEHNSSNHWNTITRVLNLLSLVSFVVGVISLMLFSISNFPL